ncbi:MAG: tetraacyldisaccharide 4'-kinase, partial [Acidobacteria bacterium]|nr:tetraacyldisaccharide 4'-kinase [Acidobacteriota bacterium]
MFFVYNLLLALASVILIPYYLIRGWLRGKHYGSIRRRLGGLEPSLTQTGARAIWLHAVSVGEVLSCTELVAQLRARFAAVKILVSTTTATGHKTAREKLGTLTDGIFYAPLDFPFAVRRVMRQVQPRLVIVAETEIWPNLFCEAKRFGAGLLVVNARVSDRSAPRYRRYRFFFRHVLALPDLIVAQSALDRQRLIEAGAPPEKVEVGGNLKFDYRPADFQAPVEIVALVERLKPEAVLLAGSTREGEEAQVLAAWDQLTPKHPRLLLILAPRHPERFDRVAEGLTQDGRRFLRRSRLDGEDRLELPGILLLDSLGELASLYRLAEVVFVGGSLVNWGGHNVLEPALAARPILVGPHMQNFRAITEALLAGGGMVQVNSAGELAPALERLLENRQEAKAIGERARRVAESHRGATRRAVERAELLYHFAIPNQPPGLIERLLLWAPARIWEEATRFRSRGYQSGRYIRRRLESYTVSVGNLTAGGTGKTPVVLWLIEQLQARGVSCAVLTRGYRRSSLEKITVFDPGAPVSSPLLTGDEAQIYLRRFPVALGIGADRYEAGVEIERRCRPDVFILDDGFQHPQLARDLDLVLVDVTAPFGRGKLLPLGRLREPVEALGRADVLLLTRTEPGERWQGLCKELRRYNPRAPILLSRMDPVALVKAGT